MDTTIDRRKDKRAPLASCQAVEMSMRGNRGKNTSPELLLRKKLFYFGIRGYRLHWKLPGKPDITFVRKKICIFIHGCFWHRCPHCDLSPPKTNTEYWSEKFRRNRERDLKNVSLLKNEGWNVVIVWECKLKKQTAKALDKILAFLQSTSIKPTDSSKVLEV